MNLVPGSRVLVYGVVLVFVQINPVIVSPALMIFAAAPVDAFVVPVNLMCNHPFLILPAVLGHLPGVVRGAYCWTTVVVPLLFFHVNFDVTLPNDFATGVVTVDVAPADNADGVHSESVDLVVAFEPETVVFPTSFEHTTCGVVADAGVASGTATRLPAATPIASARARTETLI